MSATNTTADSVQDHARGEDDVTRDPGHVVERGGETSIMSPRTETTNEIEVARLNVARTIDRVMTK